MPYLDFFVDFAASGQIAGVGLDSRPGDWPAVLGDDYAESSFSAGHLIRGYGFVEANFANDTGEWLCYLVHVKPFRAANTATSPVITARYGEIPARVAFADVAGALTAAGVEVRELPEVNRHAGDLFWVPRGGVLCTVVSPARAGDFDDLRVGDIIEMTANRGVEMPAGYGTPLSG